MQPLALFKLLGPVRCVQLIQRFNALQNTGLETAHGVTYLGLRRRGRLLPANQPEPLLDGTEQVIPIFD